MATIYSKIYEIQNIVAAISAASLYQRDRHLDDSECIDIFDTELVNKLSKEILDNLKNVFEKDQFFKCEMYLKPKRYENNKIVYRPIYVVNFITLTSIFAVLNVLVYQDTKIKGVKKINEVFNSIPEDFYGNVLSDDCGRFFNPWLQQYKKYSKAYIDKYSIYNNSKKYKYEYDLDLKNFFPSINPEFVYIILKNKFSKTVNSDDLSYYQNMILKTLLIETEIMDQVEGMDESEYIIKVEYEDNTLKEFARGLPQGLPQACLYSNVLMEEIRDEINNYFNGDIIFYVDDSAIFSNVEILEKDLGKKLKIIQAKINSRLNRYIEPTIEDNIDNKSAANKDLMYLRQFKDKYKIQFNLDKCTFNLIETDLFTFLNNFLQKKTSMNNDIYNSASCEDDYRGILYDFEFYDNIINKERDFVNMSHKLDDFHTSAERKSYKKKVLRLRKYYHYRHLVAQGYSDSSNLESLIDTEIKEIENIQKVEGFFEYLDDGIISPLVGLINKFYPSEKAVEKIKKLEFIFNKWGLLEVLYYKKFFNNKKLNVKISNLYNSLLIKLKYFSYQSSEYVMEKIKQIIQHTKKNNYTKYDFVLNSFEILNFKLDGFEKYETVINNSQRYIKDFMNQFFSILFNVDNSSKHTLINKRGIPLYDYQFKILLYIRSIRFEFNEVINLIAQLMENSNFDTDKKVDSSILEVIPFFERNINKITKINVLLKVHGFVKKIWSNGSKYLYFYTLHDETHSIKLIQNIDKLLSTISYLKLKDDEYYILYLACYLHDISMVLQKNVEEEFFTDIHEGTILVDQITDLIKDMKKSEKERYLGTYQVLESYFESIIRSKHAKNSGYNIRNLKYLDFLDIFLRKELADICELHNVDARKVYYGDDEDITFNIKLVKILLRLADVFDFSRDRVSKEFLDSSIKYMNNVSQFHYILHYITGDYEIKKTYSENKDLSNNIINRYSYVKKISQDVFTENIIFEINISDKIFANSNDYNNKCMGNKLYYRNEYGLTLDNFDCYYTINLDNDILYEIKGTDSTIKCNNSKCDFMCRLLSEKYKDLLRELHYLQNYINNVVKKEKRVSTLPIQLYVLFKIDENKNENIQLHSLLRQYFKDNLNREFL